MKYLKIEVFVPAENVNDIIEAINDEYLGDNNYDYVYSETPVIGYFRPLEGASPHIGDINKIETIEEMKVEFRIKKDDLSEVIKIIKREHPYEVPIINVLELIETGG